jgi:hypothetical protein
MIIYAIRLSSDTPVVHSADLETLLASNTAQQWLFPMHTRDAPDYKCLLDMYR